MKLVRRLTALALAAASLVMFDISPASAAVPAISCTQHGFGNGGARNWCVSWDGSIWQMGAGVGNPTGSWGCIIEDPTNYLVNVPGQPFLNCETVKIELVQYAGTYGQSGYVLKRTGPVQVIAAGGAVKTPQYTPPYAVGAKWFCTRLYVPRTGYWEDFHCAHTSGEVKQTGFAHGYGGKWA